MKANRILSVLGVLFIIVIIAVASAGAYINFGLPKPPVPNFVDLPAMKVVYDEYRGTCYDFDQKLPPIVTKITAQKTVCEKAIGQFGNMAMFVGRDNLYCRLGCVVKDFPKTIPEGLKTEEIPARSYVAVPREKKSFIQDIRDRYKILESVERTGAITAGMTMVIINFGKESVESVSEVYTPLIKLLPIATPSAK